MAKQQLSQTPLERVIGQKSVVERLKVFARSERRIPSLLLTSPAGYGKTRITEAFAEEAGATLHQINAVDIENAAVLNHMVGKPCAEEGDDRKIIFIDESGEMRRRIGVALLTALESPYRLETRIRRKGKVEVWRIAIPDHVSFMFATTDVGKMHKALIDRCVHLQFDDYLQEELEEIASLYFKKHGFNPTPDALNNIARISRSVRQLLQVCNCAMIFNNQRFGESIVQKILSQLQLTPSGLTKKDTKLLNYLADRNFASERDCIAFLQVEKEEYIRMEGWLRKRGLVEVCSHGRYITTLGLEEIGVDAKMDDGSMFGIRIDA